jgi:peptidoglycan/LPS O-acetylase OafA/YrhL
MKKRYAVQIAAGAVLGAAGMLLPFLVAGTEAISSLLVTIGLVILAVAVVRHWKFRDEPEKDERTQKIGAYGISYSWFLTLVFLALLFWVDYLGVVALTVETVLLATILLMGLSARIFQWYLFRQGDVA